VGVVFVIAACGRGGSAGSSMSSSGTSATSSTTAPPSSSAVATASPGTVGHVCGTGNRTPLVHFRTTDGVRLVGARYGHGAVGVVLAHQSDDDMCDWVPFARILAAHRWTALTFDFRGFPPSVSSTQHAEAYTLDVRAAVRELRQTGARRVVMIGASLGGTSVIAAAPSIHSPVNGVISISGPADYPPENAIGAVPHLAMPLLLMAATSDPFSADARRMYAASDHDHTRLVLFSGPDHGVQLVGDPNLGPRVRRLLIAFIGQATS
jgi:pimeloyl-ACP methyl ester carboxylesterase